jgi:penicillin-binding protein 2
MEVLTKSVRLRTMNSHDRQAMKKSIGILIALLLLVFTSLAAQKTSPSTAKNSVRGRASKSAAKQAPAKKSGASSASKSTSSGKAAASKSVAARKKAATKSPVRRSSESRYKQPTYADSTVGDNVDGEDLAVRRAAVDALGGYNGSMVVVDPFTGRVLSIVNQKLAFQSGFTPCSTIKLVTAVAALKEGIIERETRIRMSRHLTLDLTKALAQSHLSNGYFGSLGQKVGFERVRHYAPQFGLGEKAGWDIEEERAGIFPEEAPPTGVKLMMSFGTGISLTPLELAAFVSAVANGGTLYYLQYPRTPDEADTLVPRLKRDLDFGEALEDLRIGMRAAVESGTGRRTASVYSDPVLGKTGTCTDFGQAAHLGWFAAYNETGQRFAVVVLLTGGKAVNGPVAAGVAGQFFRNMADHTLRASGETNSDAQPACCN